MAAWRYHGVAYGVTKQQRHRGVIGEMAASAK